MAATCEHTHQGYDRGGGMNGASYLSGCDAVVSSRTSSSVSSPDSTPSASQAVLVVNAGRVDMVALEVVG